MNRITINQAYSDQLLQPSYAVIAHPLQDPPALQLLERWSKRPFLKKSTVPDRFKEETASAGTAHAMMQQNLQKKLDLRGDGWEIGPHLIERWNRRKRRQKPMLPDTMPPFGLPSL